MKKLLALVIVLVFVFATVISVYADGMTIKSIDTVMSEIRAEQNVQANDKINMNKIGQDKLEELGDSVMEAMIGNTTLHDQMDVRMGGDGSTSLTEMHIRIGQNYLIGNLNSLMGSYGENSWNSMMGNFGRNGMMNSYVSTLGNNYGSTFGNGMMANYENNGWNRPVKNDNVTLTQADKDLMTQQGSNLFKPKTDAAQLYNGVTQLDVQHYYGNGMMNDSWTTNQTTKPIGNSQTQNSAIPIASPQYNGRGMMNGNWNGQNNWDDQDNGHGYGCN